MDAACKARRPGATWEGALSLADVMGESDLLDLVEVLILA